MLGKVKANVYGRQVEIPAGFEDYFDPTHTAIVEVDMHGGHLDPDATCPSYRCAGLIDSINEFNARARQLKIPVIHCKTTMRKNYVDDDGRSSWRRMMLLNPDWKRSPEQTKNHGIEGTRWSEFSVDVMPEDYVVNSKKRLSCFYPATDLEFLLRQLWREVVVITGLFSDCCDLCTAFEAANRDFKVVVPKDLQRGYSEEMEEAAAKIVSLYLGVVVESKELVAEWKRRLGKVASGGT